MARECLRHGQAAWKGVSPGLIPDCPFPLPCILSSPKRAGRRAASCPRLRVVLGVVKPEGEPRERFRRPGRGRTMPRVNVRPRGNAMAQGMGGRCRNGYRSQPASGFYSATLRLRVGPVMGSNPTLGAPTRDAPSPTVCGTRSRVACIDCAKAHPRTGEHGGLLHAGSKEEGSPREGSLRALTPDVQWLVCSGWRFANHHSLISASLASVMAARTAKARLACRYAEADDSARRSSLA